MITTITSYDIDWKSQLEPGFCVCIKTIKETDINSYVQIKPSYKHRGKAKLWRWKEHSTISCYNVCIKDKAIDQSNSHALSCWGLTVQSPTIFLLQWQLRELQQAQPASDCDKVSNVNYLERDWSFPDNLHTMYHYDCKQYVVMLTIVQVYINCSSTWSW